MTPEEMRPLVTLYMYKIRAMYNPNEAMTPTGIVRPKTNTRKTQEMICAETVLMSITMLVTGNQFESHRLSGAWYDVLREKAGEYLTLPEMLNKLSTETFIDAMIEALDVKFNAFKVNA